MVALESQVIGLALSDRDGTNALDPEYLAQYNSRPLVVVSIVFLSLSWISILLRTYVRTFLTRNFLMDDWFMVAAQCVYTVSCVFMFLGVYYGLGKHNIALDIHDMTQALMYQALTTETYVLNMMLLKFSIGIFLLRLAMRKIYTYTIWGSLIIVGIWSVVILIWNILQCDPIVGQWDITIENRKCVSTNQILAAAYSVSVMTIVTDWLYAILPIPMLWGVRMTTQTKITVIAILGLGVFASIATLIRFKYLVTINDHTDVLYSSTDAFIWTMVEPAVATIASSLSTIRPLLRQFRVRGFESTESNGYAVGRQRSGQNRSHTHSEGSGFRNLNLELGDKKTTMTTTVVGATGNRSPSSSVSDIIASTARSSPTYADTHRANTRPISGKGSGDSNFNIPNGAIILETCIKIQSHIAEETDPINPYQGISSSPTATSEKGILKHSASRRRPGVASPDPLNPPFGSLGRKSWSNEDDRSLEESNLHPLHDNSPLGSNPPTGY